MGGEARNVEGGKVSYIARVPVHLMNGIFFFFL
jgi:hypothetical protein